MLGPDLLGLALLFLETPAIEALTRLATTVPYTVRFERTEQALAELRNAIVPPQNEPLTARAIISNVCGSLAPGWQATRLPGRIIIYREAVDDYPGAEVIARS